ncbi:MAG TPA: type III PLP-dependent enzyme [Herpetosiphonaceae bacterium]|nr:type III PLP-dependent enzyme [Herpetosiphonaceae bacterium]
MNNHPAVIEALLRDWKQTRDEPVCAYIHDLGRLRGHVAAVAGQLPPQCQLFYAMKANPAAPILETLAPLVHGIEVASLGEIEKVRAIGASIPIIFGGPGKTDHEIAGAIAHGVRLIHVESLHELRRIGLISQRLDRTVAILLRVNLRGPFPVATLQMGGATQFGIDEADVPAALAIALAEPTIRLEGFHFHSISNNLDPDAHADLVAYYIERARAWAAEGRFPLRYINAGGGIGVNYADLDQQFDWPRFCDRLRRICADTLPAGATIIFECGRYLAAACGFYAAEVLDVKRNHGKTYVIVRGGSHQFRLPVSWNHNHPFAVIAIDAWPYPFARPEVSAAPVAVVGQLCTPKDVLVREKEVARLRAGDIVLFQYAGAYGWTISHHEFLSHPHPAQIYLDGDAAAEPELALSGEERA